MPKSLENTHSDRPVTDPAPRAHHVVAAAVFLVAWLSFIVFVALYRAPLPSDAFAALSFDLIARAEAAAR